MRATFLTPIFLVWLLFHAASAHAQEDAPASDAAEATPGDVFGALFGEALPDRVSQMTNRVIDGYLTYLAKPETTKKLAAFHKNYYDALVEQGFTREQAFELLLRFGNPLTDMPAMSR